MIAINEAYFADDHKKDPFHWDKVLRKKFNHSGYTQVELSDAMWPVQTENEVIDFDWGEKPHSKMEDDLESGFRNEIAELCSGDYKGL